MKCCLKTKNGCLKSLTKHPLSRLEKSSQQKTCSLIIEKQGIWGGEHFPFLFFLLVDKKTLLTFKIKATRVKIVFVLAC